MVRSKPIERYGPYCNFQWIDSRYDDGICTDHMSESRWLLIEKLTERSHQDDDPWDEEEKQICHAQAVYIFTNLSKQCADAIFKLWLQ